MTLPAKPAAIQGEIISPDPNGKLDKQAQRIVDELERMAYADIRSLLDSDGNLLPPDQWPDDIAATISGIEVETLWQGKGEEREPVGTVKKIKRFDKNKILEMLGRHKAIFHDRIELDITDNLAERLANMRRRRLASGG